MKNKITLLHEKSLHEKYINYDPLSRPIYIWDNEYYKNRGYSFKKLIFIYETLCSLPVEIFYGDTFNILDNINPDKIIINYTTDSNIKSIIDMLGKKYYVYNIYDEDFVELEQGLKFNRFFKYWNKIKSLAFTKDGKK